MHSCSRTARCSPICKNGFSRPGRLPAQNHRGVGIGNDALVFRVRSDHIGDLRLERREGDAREMLGPGLLHRRGVIDRGNSRRTGSCGRLVTILAQVRDDAESGRQDGGLCKHSGRARSANDGRPGGTPAAQTSEASPRLRARFCRARSPVRLATRKMWVSTAMVAWPNAVLRMTLAVLRPTPGSSSSAARRRRHLAGVTLQQQAAHGDDVLGLAIVESDGLDVAREPPGRRAPAWRQACSPRGTVPPSPCSRSCRLPARKG